MCATHAAANLSVLGFKISVLRQKLVICATRAGAIFGELVFKINILRRKFVIICATRAAANLGLYQRFTSKISHLCHTCRSNFMPNSV